MKGKIDISKLKVPPEKHELETARFFSERGYDIEFIPPSNSPNIHTPDIKMEGVEWEMKSPQGKGRRTIEKAIRQAVKQSHYIIVDLKRVKIPESKVLSQLEKEYNSRPYISRLYVITSGRKLIKFFRK